MNAQLTIDPEAPLVFEYAKLGIYDLSIPFVYRFRGPMDTAWVTGALTFPALFYNEHALEAFALEKWSSYLDAEFKRADAMPEGDHKETLSEAVALFFRTKVTVVECDIVPKKTVQMATVPT